MRGGPLRQAAYKGEMMLIHFRLVIDAAEPFNHGLDADLFADFPAHRLLDRLTRLASAPGQLPVPPAIAVPNQQ